MIQFLSLFSGIGAFEKALDRLGVPYNLVNYCEIDKYASKSYSAVHNVPESLNLGDITKVDTSKLPHIDMISYGFPCQDISLAGKQKGLKLVCGKCNTVHEISEDEVKKILIGQPIFCEKCGEELDLTRSGLFFQALRIIKDTKPKVAIAENVKNLTGKKFKDQFAIVLESLESAGYNNYWQVLNAKDYGVPQNRERVFIVSIRKDIDTGWFKFPEPFELNLRLKDLLEPVVDEKFYLSKDMFNYAFNIVKEAKGIGFSDSVDKSYINPNIANTIGCRSAYGQRSGTSNYVSNDIEQPLSVKDMKDSMVSNPTVKQIGNCCPTKTRANPNQGRIYDTEGLSPALNCMTGGNRQPCVPVCLNSKGGRGGVEGLQPSIQDRVYDAEAISTAVTTSYMPSIAVREATKKGYAEAYEGDYAFCVDTAQTGGVKEKYTDGQLRIRKLTPLECWRLMGFDDEDFYRAEKVNSNSQLYKQAGNSIVVDVLEYLFEEIMEVLDMKKVEDKVIVYECDDLINLEALKEKEPDLYAELLADYPCESATYVFKHEAVS